MPQLPSVALSLPNISMRSDTPWYQHPQADQATQDILSALAQSMKSWMGGCIRKLCKDFFEEQKVMRATIEQQESVIKAQAQEIQELRSLRRPVQRQPSSSGGPGSSHTVSCNPRQRKVSAKQKARNRYYADVRRKTREEALRRGRTHTSEMGEGDAERETHLIIDAAGSPQAPQAAPHRPAGLGGTTPDTASVGQAGLRDAVEAQAHIMNSYALASQDQTGGHDNQGGQSSHEEAREGLGSTSGPPPFDGCTVEPSQASQEVEQLGATAGGSAPAGLSTDFTTPVRRPAISAPCQRALWSECDGVDPATGLYTFDTYTVVPQIPEFPFPAVAGQLPGGVAGKALEASVEQLQLSEEDLAPKIPTVGSLQSLTKERLCQLCNLAHLPETGGKRALATRLIESRQDLAPLLATFSGPGNQPPSSPSPAETTHDEKSATQVAQANGEDDDTQLQEALAMLSAAQRGRDRLAQLLGVRPNTELSDALSSAEIQVAELEELVAFCRGSQSEDS